ncbi:uncharacterized protein LOC143219705 [Lasioglossum baleicum]|uniref:uncharacterized protein LOC143219705 n=1 Tax=Lasioglossum baleicum TaxID=434251 RepID=UPI003FCE0917
MASPAVFLSPLPIEPRGQKRDRDGGDPSESETEVSDAGSFNSELTKKARQGEEGEIVILEEKTEERDLLELVDNLLEEITRGRRSATETIKLLRTQQVPCEDVKKAKARAVQTDRHITTMWIAAKAIEGIAKLRKIREARRIQETATQCSPGFIQRYIAEETKKQREEVKIGGRRGEKAEGKSEKGNRDKLEGKNSGKGNSKGKSAGKATKDRTFADLFKTLKSEASSRMEGIHTVKKSRGGNLIIKMRKDTNCNAMEQTVRDTLGKDFQVKKLTPKITLEIKDLDPTLEKEEVRKEIADSLKLGEWAESEIEVRSLRSSFEGTKTAIVSVPVESMRELGEGNRIQIGFTMCRVARALNIIRCFRCHEFGHTSYDCKTNIDGSEICRRCSTVGHSINGCTATRCCILCIRKGVPGAKAEHVAGAMNCPQYRKNAQHLLAQTAVELKVDAVLIADPLHNPGPWVFGSGNTTAIWVTGCNGLARYEDEDTREEDFTAVRLGEYMVSKKTEGRRIILGGDFNAHSTLWGSTRTNDRGRTVMEELLSEGLHPVKPGGGPTFLHGNRSSNIDFVAISNPINTKIRSQVLDIESDSDHRYVLTTIDTEIQIPRKCPFRPKWKPSQESMGHLRAAFGNTIEKEHLNNKAVFDENLPKNETKYNNDLKVNLWWDKELGTIRDSARYAKRRIQRERAKIRDKGKGPEELEILEIQYKDTIRELRRKISMAKVRKWKEFCEELNNDVWGKPYKTIISRVKMTTPPATLSREFSEKVLRGLFPKLPTDEEGSEESVAADAVEEEEYEDLNVPEISIGEIRAAAAKITPRKAAGLDGMLPEIIKELATYRPDPFAALFTGLLRRGKMPRDWKRARTVLLRKPGKDPSLIAAYRPICILNAIAKLFEYVLKGRFTEFMGEQPFDKEQFGFTKGKSTIHAMDKVKGDIQRCIKKQRDREIAYSTIGHEITLKAEMGVPQGSVLYYFHHLDKTEEKVNKVQGELARLMANYGGPTYAGRRLYYNITESITCYGGPMWAEKALKFNRNCKKIARIQRAGLNRVAYAYRSVGRYPLCAITGYLPLEYTLANQKPLYEASKKFRIEIEDDDNLCQWKIDQLEDTKKNIDTLTWRKWHDHWQQQSTDVWTKQLIPDPVIWKNRKYGSLNFRLTQCLTGHGVFKAYLFRIKKANNDKCWWCDERDDAEHTVFRCEKWEPQRMHLQIDLDQDLTVDTFSECILKNKDNWNKINTFINKIIDEKEKYEREL